MDIKEKYDILNNVSDGIFKSDLDNDMDSYWKLVRSGYIKNLISMGRPDIDWKFILTEKGEKFLEDIKEIIKENNYD
jgi:predicted transcriptional regulator